MMNIALLLSGGTGARAGGDIPKQYQMAGGRRIISYSLKLFVEADVVDAVQVVSGEAWRDVIAREISVLGGGGKFRGFSDPGENRQLSIVNGLRDIRAYAGDEDRVLIHDAARPMLTEELVVRCIEAASKSDGVLPVLPMKDTVYRCADGAHITSLLDRGEIFAGQAPEVFVLGKYWEANRKLTGEQIRKVNGSTEPAVMAGMDIAVIPGDEGNYKITTAADLEKFRSHCGEKKS